MNIAVKSSINVLATARPTEVSGNPFMDYYDTFFSGLQSDPDDIEQDCESVTTPSHLPSVGDDYCGHKVVDRIGSMIQLTKWSQELKDQPIIVSTSPRKEWGRNMPWADGLRGWRRNQTSVAEFCAPFAEPLISQDKDGNMFSGADLKDRARRKEEVTAIYLMSFDSDTGQPDEDIIPRLQAAGHAFLKYTSHSNGKTEDKTSLRALRKFDSTISDTPTDDDLQRYLAGKRTKDGDIGSGRGYWPSLAASAKITAISGEGDATVVEFSHDPIHKYRVILPLAAPFIVNDETRREAENNWKALYVHTAEQLGIWFDPACVDLARAFFVGRAKTLENYNCVVGGTTPLVLPDVTPEILARAQKDKPAPRAKSGKKGKPGAKFGQDIRQEYYINSEEFDVVNWLHAAGCEEVGWGSHDKQTFVCPNVDEHTENKPDDVGCVAISPAVSESGRAIITCLHGHCRDMHTEDFLQMICEGLVANDPNYPVPLISDHLMYFMDSFDETPEAAEGAEGTGEVPTPQKKKAAVPKFDSLKRLLKGSKDSGFKVEGSNVIYKSPDDDYPKTVCQAFEVIGQSRDGIKSEWGVLIEFEDRDKHPHRFVVAQADLHSKDGALRKKLARVGFKIRVGGGMFETLMDSLDPAARVLSVIKPGWISDTQYCCPDGTVVSDPSGGVEEIILLKKPFTGQVAGTLEKQLKAWEIAFLKGSHHHFLGALAGAAGVVVQYVGFDSTPVLTLSGDSRGGKTTAEMLGAGVSGIPDTACDGPLYSLRTTDNQSENWFMRATGGTIFLDETKLFKGNLEEFVFMIASGVGKGRMYPNSSDQTLRTWKGFCVVSSEHSLVSLIEQAGRVANTGFSARCADIDCSGVTKIPKADYDKMLTLIKENHGHIGPLFVAHVMRAGGFEVIRERIAKKVTTLAGEGASALVESSAAVFAILWETGEMLQAARLLPTCIVEGEVEERIRAIWTAYQHSDEAAALAPGNTSIDRLRDTLYARTGRDVHDIDADSPRYAETVAWFKQKDLTMTFYVRSDKIVELAGGVPKRRALITALKEAGILTPSGEKTNTWDVLPGGFKTQHYRLAFKLDPEVEDPFAG